MPQAQGPDYTDSEDISVSTTAIGTTASKQVSTSGARRRYALCGVGANSIRYTVDGSTPTATSGQVVAANAQFALTNPDSIRKLKMIRVAADSVVNVQYAE